MNILAVIKVQGPKFHHALFSVKMASRTKYLVAARVGDKSRERSRGAGMRKKRERFVRAMTSSHFLFSQSPDLPPCVTLPNLRAATQPQKVYIE